MNLNQVIEELRTERDNIDRAIESLQRIAAGQKRRGRPPKWLSQISDKPRRGRPPGSKNKPAAEE